MKHLVQGVGSILLAAVVTVSFISAAVLVWYQII